MIHEEGGYIRRVAAYVPEEVRVALEAIAVAEERSISQVARMALTSYAARRMTEMRNQDV